jgi:arsenite methyltransferase
MDIGTFMRGKGNGTKNSNGSNFEAAVLQRYAEASRKAEAGLCVPISYDRSLLEVIPQEVIEKDYGCGDPSRYIHQGETVLDLGSGSGKACYIIAQIAGAKGKVIGIDFNPPMLALARKYQKSVGDKLGYHNVEFRRGKIQDLRTNLELIDQCLRENPVRSVADLARLEEFEETIRREQPLVADESIDVIVSNCVLNLVRPEDKKVLFAEMYRVLKRGGRVAISDIVSDEPVPEHLAKDPNLWSACVSGAFLEEDFLRAFEEAKFYGIKQVVDDDDHVLPRGVRVAVCEKTFELYSKPPYQDQFVLVPPRQEVPRERAGVFDCSRDHKRHARETKGMEYNVTQISESVCGPGSNCCP